MFSKLMKYEWKSYRKSNLFIFIALICITIVGMISIALFNVDNLFNNSSNDFMHTLRITSFIGIFMIYYFGIIACSLAAVIMIAIRYYKTMFTDQGYLTHTLPVTRMKLYSAKLTSAILFQLCIIFMILVSVIILVLTLGTRITSFDEMIRGLADGFSELMASYSFGEIFGTCTIYLLFGIVSMVTSIIILYAAITLGQLFTKHRIIGAIIFYFGINIFLQIIFFILSFTCGLTLVNQELSVVFYNYYYGLATLVFAIVGVIMFFITKWQLQKNLNLE